MFYLITLYFYEKNVEYNYNVAFFYGIITKLMMQKCIVLDVCDDENVQKFVISLSAMVHVVQYVKLRHIDRH